MKYYLPSLYMAMNADNDERGLDYEWDVNVGKFEEFLKTAPQVVKDFYEQVGSLHDSIFRFIPAYDREFARLKRGSIFFDEGSECFLIYFDEVVFKPGFSVKLKIECDELVVDNALTEEFSCDVQMFLYDEFQDNDGVLSYHFFGTNGVEYGFKGIVSFQWEITKISS
jgi:hypothetical protein